jgi:hypothetical protein
MCSVGTQGLPAISDSSPAFHVIPRHLMNRKVNHNAHISSPPLIPVLSQLQPTHPFYITWQDNNKIHFKIRVESTKVAQGRAQLLAFVNMEIILQVL